PNRDRVIEHPRKARHRDMTSTVEGYIFVNFVRHAKDFLATANFADRGQFLAGKDLPRGVARIAYHDEFRQGRDRPLEFVDIERPVRGTERDSPDPRSIPLLERVAMVGVARLEQDNLVARFEERGADRLKRAGRSARDRDLSDVARDVVE